MDQKAIASTLRLADAIIRDVYFDCHKQLDWSELMDMNHARARIQKLLQEIADGQSHIKS